MDNQNVKAIDELEQLLAKIEMLLLLARRTIDQLRQGGV